MAGTGKTLTCGLMAQMFYLTSDPVVKSCATSTTAFSLKALFAGSASVPAILDEYKPTEMGLVRTSLLLQAFRLAYNQGSGSSGGMTKGAASGSFRDITDYTYSTPLAFCAEAQETQTAIVQRSLPIGFNLEQTKRHTPSWDIACAGRVHMSGVGRVLLRHSFRETVESRREALEPIIKTLRASADRMVHDRQVYNLAVVIEGINYFDTVMSTIFGDALKDDIDKLRAALYDQESNINVTSMSEAAKMLNDLSLISRVEAADSTVALREAYEYVVKDGYIEILMREAFVKYFTWCKRTGMPPYYATAEACMSAMGKMPAIMDVNCFGSPLKTSGQTRVFRFSLSKLTTEGVEMFKVRGT